MTAPIAIEACVSDAEKVALNMAAERLQSSLREAAGVPVSVQVTFRATHEELEAIAGPCIVVTSLQSEVDTYREPWAVAESRLRSRYQALSAIASATVFVVTVFRHVNHVEVDQIDAVRTRIRRLDRLAAEISREYGVMVMDIDRDFANIGARNLETNYRLCGTYAAQLAAKTIVLAILSAGLDEYVSFEAQDVAKLLVANDNIEVVVKTSTEVMPSNILAVGSRRHKQAVKTIVDTNSESHAGWLVRMLFSGRLSLADALSKLRSSVARRGLKASLALLMAAFRQSFSARRAN